MRRKRCRLVRGTWCGPFYRQPPVQPRPVPRGNKPCPNGCNSVGVCNYDTGECDCPAGEGCSMVQMWLESVHLMMGNRQLQLGTALFCSSDAWPCKCCRTTLCVCSTSKQIQCVASLLASCCRPPAGWTGTDCKKPFKRPCTNRVGSLDSDKAPWQPAVSLAVVHSAVCVHHAPWLA